MISSFLKNYVKENQCTLLGAGPMSKNSVIASVELSNYYNVPIMLISSRRQIDCKEVGGGYVNNWDTLEYSKFVKSIDSSDNIILARDHGGPWQNSIEVKNNLNETEAMKSAKLSFKNDIDAGFKVIHIDPSIDIHADPGIETILDRVFELYEYCWNYAKKTGKDICFEIGTEEQSGNTNSINQVEYTLSKIYDFCVRNSLDPPTFYVVQTGTKVAELRNIGTFDFPFRVENEVPAEIQIPKMVDICNKYDILLKQHNTDYLSDSSLSWHPKLEIHSANIAPEFGVTESMAFYDILIQNNIRHLADQFLSISYDSLMWEKWLIKDTEASDFDKSIIAGHYIFSQDNFIDLYSKAEGILLNKGINLERYLVEKVKHSITRYLKCFNLI